MSIQIFHDRLSCIEVRCLYVNCNWKQSSHLANTSLHQKKALKSEFGKVRVIPQFTTQGLDKLAKTLEDDESRYFSESCTSIILDLFFVKVSIPMIIWIALIDLKRVNCHLKMRFLANCLVDHAQIQSMHMRLECGMPLDVSRYLFAVGCVAPCTGCCSLNVTY